MKSRNSCWKLETGKLVERGKGILDRELGLSEQEAHLALEHQSQEKRRPLKQSLRRFILSGAVKRRVIPSD